MVQRKEYLNQLIENRDRQIIKVITGIRRCGKSTLFSLYIDWLQKNGVSEEQIISVNLEDLDYEELKDYHNLHSYIKTRLCKGKQTYVFIDEIQNCKDFEKAVDSLFLHPDIDIYITGSNAYMLSGELATLLSGRYITIDMLPFSFREYYDSFQSATIDKQECFNDYLHFGSFPYAAGLPRNEQSIFSYLEGIYHTILLKDVAKREGITDISVLENIVHTLASSLGSPISAKKIADTLCSAGRKISSAMVERYLHALTDSYLFYSVQRYDIKGRQFLKTLGKYYIADTGLRNYLLSDSRSDLGHLLENIVYLELLRRYHSVYIGKMEEKEVDFIARDMNGILYYQVAATVLDDTVLKRELAPLRKIKDNHPKILLTLDTVGSGANYDGIRQYNLIDWLLSS